MQSMTVACAPNDSIQVIVWSVFYIMSLQTIAAAYLVTAINRRKKRRKYSEEKSF